MADPAQNATAQAFLHNLHMMNDALVGIGDLVGMPEAWTDPDTIRRRVKDIRTERNVFQTRNEELEARLAEWQIASQTSATRADRLEAERDTAQARASELEKTLEAARSATHTYASAEIQSNKRAVKAEARVKELEAELGKLSSAGIKVEPANDYTAEVHAARIDALKTLGVNPYDPPVCVIGAAKKRAKTLEHVQKFEDELAQIWELWGAGRPMTLGCVYEAAQEMERLNTVLHMKLGTIAELLDDAKIPKSYGRDQKGGPIPLPERVSVLIAAHDQAMHESKNWMDATMREAGEATDAHLQLDDLGAPRYAGSASLSIAARIRALPGLLRAE